MTFPFGSCLVLLCAVAFLYQLPIEIEGKPGGRGNIRRPDQGTGSSDSDSSSSSNSAVPTSVISTSSKAAVPRARKVSPWGSSGGSRVQSGRGSSGVARSKSSFQAASASAFKTSNNRLSPNPPVPTQSALIQPVLTKPTSTINDYGIGAIGGSRAVPGTGNLMLAGAGGAVGGYLLGRMLSRSLYHDVDGCCYSCDGCQYNGAMPPSYYDSYIPYGYRHSDNKTGNSRDSAIIPDTNGNETIQVQKPKDVDLCTLGRWNMELPYTELPNMALTLLVNDDISGNSTDDKARFLYEFFNATAASYGTLALDETINVFNIPPHNDLSLCNFLIPKPPADSTQDSSSDPVTSTISAVLIKITTTKMPWYGNVPLLQWREMVRSGDRSMCIAVSFANLPECRDWNPASTGPEEPFMTGVKQVIRWYSNVSADPQLAIDLVASAKRCFPTNQSIITPKEILPCLDFSINATEILTFPNASSVFGNDDICQPELLWHVRWPDRSAFDSVLPWALHCLPANWFARKFINPDIFKCIPDNSTSTFSCTLVDLVNLNVFARNYFLCDDPVDADLITRLLNRQPIKPPNIDIAVSTTVPSVLVSIGNSSRPKTTSDADRRLVNSWTASIVSFCLSVRFAL